MTGTRAAGRPGPFRLRPPGRPDQFNTGLIVTGMRNAVMWGQYILFFMFFVGLSAGGLIVASAGRLFGVKALKPITRLAVLEATVAVMLAATFILPDLGRPERIPADAGAGGALTGRGRAAGREPRGEAEFCPAP